MMVANLRRPPPQAVLGGNSSPSEADIKKILGSGEKRTLLSLVARATWRRLLALWRPLLYILG